MELLYLKAIHIVFVVSWFAGLFYCVRLFIYHVEAEDKPDNERFILQRQFRIMEKKLWYIITTPSMILTIGTGTAMIILEPSFMQQPWMHVKLMLVLLLVVYHFLCWNILVKLKSVQFSASSIKLRMWNEVATLLLVAIVFTVVLKSAINWLWGVGGLVVLGVLLMLIVKLVNSRKG